MALILKDGTGYRLLLKERRGGNGYGNQGGATGHNKAVDNIYGKV